MSIRPAAKTPCANCPWRISNQGKRHPSGWYTKANLRRLWAGLRGGVSMSCHPTDPGNPVSLEDQEAGYKPAPEGMEPRECAGALIVKQREFQIFSTVCKRADSEGQKDGLKRYRKLRRRGLTREGIALLASRMLFHMPGEVEMTKPDLLTEDVGHPDLPFAEEEIEMCKETARQT